MIWMLNLGKIKAKFGGSNAGHNGVASIDKFIGKDYSRIRIGIGKPQDKIQVADYVLQNFNEDEVMGIEKITENIIDSISILLDKKLDLFSSTVNNKKIEPKNVELLDYQMLGNHLYLML